MLPPNASPRIGLMAEEGATPDLLESWGQAAEATNRRDFDAVMSLFDHDAVWESRAGTFEGAAAVRSFFEDWWGNYEETDNVIVEGRNLGNGVMFAAHRLDGRPVGSTRVVQERFGLALVWTAGLIVRVVVYSDIDEARAAAERLAQERG
jgi:ketosteroid isomerase-like protein